MISLNPLYVYKSENKEIENILKMENMKENYFLACSQKNIFLFKYIINEYDNNIKIELIKVHDIKDDIIDFVIIEKDKKEIIAIYSRCQLFILNIPNFELIHKLNLRSMNKNSLIQLNKNELLIIDNNYYFKIVDLNMLKIKLIIKSNNSNDFLLNNKDGTLIQSNYYGIKRFLIKNMEELPDLIQINNDDYDDYYEYDYYTEEIVYMHKLKDGRIISCHQSGKIEIYNLKFI